MKNNSSYRESGFSLVELLVVMVLMGLVSTAIFSVYRTSQNTAGGEDDIVEMQQQLRIAMDVIAADIRMAGYLVKNDPLTLDLAPLRTALPGQIKTRTATFAGNSMTIAVDKNFVASAGVATTFEVLSDEQLEMFNKNDCIKIYRPETRSQIHYKTVGAALVPFAFWISSVTPGDKATGTPPKVNLQLSTSSTSPVGAGESLGFKRGDVMVKTTGTPPANCIAGDFPEGVAIPYNTTTTQPFTIQRYGLRYTSSIASAQATVGHLAGPLSASLTASDSYPRFSMAFEYLMDDGSVLTAVYATKLDQIRAVRVTLTGTSRPTERNPQGRTRQLSTVVALRNR